MKCHNIWLMASLCHAICPKTRQHVHLQNEDKENSMYLKARVCEIHRLFTFHQEYSQFNIEYEATYIYIHLNSES